jgi:hypothetical protein
MVLCSFPAVASCSHTRSFDQRRRGDGLASMTSNTFCPKGAQQFLGMDRTNAAEHARGKVLFDAFDRSGVEVLRNRALNC